MLIFHFVTKFSFYSVSFGSFMSYVCMSYLQHKDQSSSVLHWRHSMLSYHGSLLDLFLSHRWYVDDCWTYWMPTMEMVGLTFFILKSFFFKLETLLKFFPVAAYRNLTLQCLTEVKETYTVPTSVLNFNGETGRYFFIQYFGDQYYDMLH